MSLGSYWVENLLAVPPEPQSGALTNSKYCRLPSIVNLQKLREHRLTKLENKWKKIYPIQWYTKMPMRSTTYTLN